MTAFSVLYPFIRASVGDTGSVYLIDNGTLDLYIATALQIDAAWRQNANRATLYIEGAPDGSGNRQITPDWQDPRDMPILFFEAALVGVSSSRLTAGHTAGRMTVRRGHGPWDLVSYLEGKLNAAQYGEFNCMAFSEWWGQFLQGTSRGIAQISSFPG